MTSKREGGYTFLVLGAGLWGKEWMRVLAADDRCRIAGVVARSQSTLNSVSEEFTLDSKHLFTSYEEALARVDADVALVAVPPDIHHEVLMAALHRGCHILCEKPLTATWDEAVDVAKLASTRPDQVFMVAQTRRWSSHIRALAACIASGKVGTPESVRIDHRVHNRHPGWREDLQYPVLEDMAAHHFDALRCFTGQDAISVFAQSFNPSWSWYKGQATSSALIRMTGGLHVNYFGSWCTQGEQTSWEGKIEIIGEKGSLRLVDESTLEFYPADAKRAASTSPTPERIAFTPEQNTAITGPLNEFIAALQESRQPECCLQDNLKTFAIVCAAVESCRTGNVVNVNTVAM